MRRPKPRFRVFLKTRFKHPLTLPYDLTYINEAGDQFQENFSAHTAIFYIMAAALIFISFVYLNTTIWYFLLWALVLFIFSYLRYFWAEFYLLNENNEPIESENKRSGWWKALIALELVLMIGLPIVVYTASIDSPYFKVWYPIEDGETYHRPADHKIEDFWQAYDAAINFVEQNAPSAVITQYGTVVYPDGEESYYFTFKNQTPSAFIRRTFEFHVLLIYYSRDFHYGSYCSNWGYDSLYSAFKPIDPPATEIDTQKIIDILYVNTGLNKEDAEYFYISTHFFTDLPELSNPGGDNWAVQVVIADTRYYYTVNLTEGTAVLEKTEPIEGEESS